MTTLPTAVASDDAEPGQGVMCLCGRMHFRLQRPDVEVACIRCRGAVWAYGLGRSVALQDVRVLHVVDMATGRVRRGASRVLLHQRTGWCEIEDGAAMIRAAIQMQRSANALAE